MLWMLLTACVPDDSFLLGTRALDYWIDRTRVVAVRATPSGRVAGEPRTIDALVLSPYPIEGVGISVCGLRDDALVYVWGMECFSNPDLVTELGDTLPLVWETPDYSAIECGDPDTSDTAFSYDTTCEVQVPILVTATSAEDTGYGGALVWMPTVPNGRIGPGPEGPEPTHVLEVRGEPRPGAELELVYTVGGGGYDYFQWWVDAGTLRDTGRTGLTVRTDALRETRNRLVVPEDFAGPLRVAVVGNSRFGPRSQIWDVVTVEVRP